MVVTANYVTVLGLSMKLSFVRPLFGKLSQYISQLTTLEHDSIYHNSLIIRNTIFVSKHVFDIRIEMIVI